MERILSAALLLFSVSACQESVELSVMTYNVENLFDTEDNPKIKDDTYLPLSIKKARGSEQDRICKEQTVRNQQAQKLPFYYYQCMYLDWSEELLNDKLDNIAEVILAYPSSHGVGPDVVMLQEVENQNVVDQLNDKLTAAGYTTATTLASGGGRGITMAVLSRLPLKEAAKMHNWTIKDPDSGEQRVAKRGYLEVNLDIGHRGKYLTFLNTHLPSNGHPDFERAQGLEQMIDLAESLQTENNFIVAGGDFNIAAEDSQKLYDDIAATYFKLAHKQTGCKEGDLKSACRGTSYYSRNKTWSYLDNIMVSKDSLKQYQQAATIKPGSVQVFNPLENQKTFSDRPLRFFTNIKRVDTRKGQVIYRDEDVGIGVSDHWPLTIVLEGRLTRQESNFQSY